MFTNSTGAFAALRLDAKLEPIRLSGRTMAEDLDRIQPLRSWARQNVARGTAESVSTTDVNDIVEWSGLLVATREDDEAGDLDVAPDIRVAMELCKFITPFDSVLRYQGFPQLRPLWAHHGADILFHLGDQLLIPAHKMVLMARIPAMGDLLFGRPVSAVVRLFGQRKATLSFAVTHHGCSQSTIHVKGCSLMSILILCHYLYTDEVVTIWDRRVNLAISEKYGSLMINALVVKAELQALASESCLRLPTLEATLRFVGKAPSTPTLVRDIQRLFEGDMVEHDVLVHLVDGNIKAHSFVLRSRSDYFSTLFDEECWTVNRFEPGKGPIDIDLKEFKHLPMSYLFRYLYGATAPELFDDLGRVST